WPAARRGGEAAMGELSSSADERRRTRIIESASPPRNTRKPRKGIRPYSNAGIHETIKKGQSISEFATRSLTKGRWLWRPSLCIDFIACVSSLKALESEKSRYVG